jgi:hypothetical protein
MPNKSLVCKYFCEIAKKFYSIVLGGFSRFNLCLVNDYEKSIFAKALSSTQKKSASHGRGQRSEAMFYEAL